MEQMRLAFEMALKNKLSQKSSYTQSEETALMKNFRYYDIDSDGYLSMNEWFKAIEKIGVVLPTMGNLKELFYLYDSDNDGKICCKEFCDIVFRQNPIGYIIFLH